MVRLSLSSRRIARAKKSAIVSQFTRARIFARLNSAWLIRTKTPVLFFSGVGFSFMVREDTHKMQKCQGIKFRT